MAIAVAAGAALGVVYSLSPLTVWFIASLPLIWLLASRQLSQTERRWLAIVLTVAVTVRLAVLAGLFLSADAAVPYANLFGDEELFKRRSLWMRNIGLGVPVHGADVIYAFDETGRSSYLYLLAYMQALVGAAPYGVHLFNAALYLFGVVVLYRVVRGSYGGLVAMIGLVLLLFLPSLLTWSISALKEPLYICACAVELWCAVQIVRAPRWWQRGVAVLAVLALAYLLQTLRFGAAGLVIVGTVGGLFGALMLSRARYFVVCLIVLAVLVPALLSRPAVQQRLMSGVALAAFQHWGHIATPGYTYKLLEPRYYAERLSVRGMSPPDAGRYIARALWSYVVVPLPWRIESRAMLAFLPEQIAWYCIVFFSAIGFFAGLRRDLVVTSLLAAHALSAILMVALTGGNVGTLVRHRGLAMPYLAWFAALGAVTFTAYLIRGTRRVPAIVPPAEVQPAWP